MNTTSSSGVQKTIAWYRASIRVGWFLALREIRRSSRWSTVLIVFIMTITLLNLIVIRGILVGLIEGANIANRLRYSSDIIMTTPPDTDRIENSTHIESVLSNMSQVDAFSPRYITAGVLEAGYKEQVRTNDKADTAGASIAGIDIASENAVTQLSDAVIEGSYLINGELDTVLVGTNLLSQYQSAQSLNAQTLDKVTIGSTIRLTINNFTREVTVKGIVQSKAGQVDSRVFMNQNQVRQMMGRSDNNVDEIAVLLQQGVSDATVKNILIANGAGDTAIVQTAEEGRPQFVKDIEQTFNILGNVIGSIGLAVACISIFIVIFVNAITRRKYIGILKGIGVTEQAIEYSYMIQSFFYALFGILVSFPIIFLLLKPYFQANPINFPFSDGVLVAGFSDVFVRAILLLIATIISGYIPARIVVKQRTLDAILGR